MARRGGRPPGSRINTVVKSTDAGASWTPITDGLPPKRQVSALAVDPRRAGTVYIGLDSWSGPVGIFKTSDGGLTWNRLAAEFPVTAVAVDPAHPATIFAGVELRRTARRGTFGIVMSENNGRTWGPTGNPEGHVLTQERLRLLAVALVVCGLSLLDRTSAGAVPPPPPKFWSAARCEQVMLARRVPPLQVQCVGFGGPGACRWTSGHDARLYSKFRVFTLYRQLTVDSSGPQPGVVRAFTLATRARPGYAPIRSYYGDTYVGWPADFLMRYVRVLATHASPAQFRSIVAPIAGRLTEQENGTGCTGI